jgi:hypothetical protein
LFSLGLQTGAFAQAVERPAIRASNSDALLPSKSFQPLKIMEGSGSGVSSKQLNQASECGK